MPDLYYGRVVELPGVEVTSPEFTCAMAALAWLLGKEAAIPSSDRRRFVIDVSSGNSEGRPLDHDELLHLAAREWFAVAKAMGLDEEDAREEIWDALKEEVF